MTSASTRLSAVVVFGVVTLTNMAAFVLVVRAGEPLWPGFLPTIAFFAFPLVGVLIALRRPENRIAWLCLAIGLVWSLSGAANAALSYEAISPGLLPRPEMWLIFGPPLWVPGMFLTGTFLLLLFPDGHLPSPRWRPLAWLSAISLVLLYVFYVFDPVAYGHPGFPGVENPLGWEVLAEFPSLGSALVALLPISVVASAVALLHRFRRATGIEGLQLKWLVAAAATAGLFFGLIIAISLILQAAGADVAWVEDAGPFVLQLFVLIPISIGFALLRHRLYDIDRLVSRTVSYVMVIGLLAGVYAGGVFLLQDLLPFEGDVAVAGSTLAVAAVFNPVRRRVQRWVDRRFDRQRYDAQRLVDEFTGRLRDQVELEALIPDLTGVIGATLHPTSMSVWVRDLAPP